MISRVLWPAASVVLALYFLYCRGLGGVGWLSVDEPRYAWIGRAMAESGDWITPRLYGQPWLEKPPLLYWMIAAGWKLGLADEWAARLPVALAAVAFLAFFWWSIVREFGEETALRATLILATCGGWLLYAHVAVADIPLAVAFGASMLLAWRGHVKTAGAALGLAMLAKGLVPVALALPAIWWHRRRWRALLAAAGLALAVAGPWYAAAYARHGRALFDELILRQHLARFLDAKAQVLHPQPVWFYLPVLAALLLPWTVLAGAVRPRALWANERARFFVVWLGFGFAVFSASAGKLPGYLLPLLPAAAAVLGVSLGEARHPRWWLAAVVATAGALYAAPADKLLAAIVDMDGSPVVTSLGWLGAALGLLAGLAWLGGSLQRTAAAVAVLLAALLAWAVPIAERYTARPQAKLAPDVCAEPGLHRVWHYGLSYYARAAIPPCQTKGGPASTGKRWHALSGEAGMLLLKDGAAADTVKARIGAE